MSDPNERHHTMAETRYWCDQYRLRSEKLAAEVEALRGAQGLRVGPYTIAPAEEGKLWIHHDSGEGGRFNASELEAMIADYFNEEF